MKLMMRILATATIPLLYQGCTNDGVKRGMYETLQNIQERRCIEDRSSDCPTRESYGAYQQKRREAVQE
jgi:hypothetical protein